MLYNVIVLKRKQYFKGGMTMFISSDYYALASERNYCPSWVQSERYFNCAHFSKLLSFFWNK